MISDETDVLYFLNNRYPNAYKSRLLESTHVRAFPELPLNRHLRWLDG